MDLLVQLLALADGVHIHVALSDFLLILFLFGNKHIHAVQRHAAVVADDAPAPVGVGKSRQKPDVPRCAHFVGIHAEHAVVVGGFKAENFLDRVRKLVAVSFRRTARHTHPAERVYPAAQRRVGLQADDQLVVFVNIARVIGDERRDMLGVHVQNAAFVTLFLH